VSGGRLPQPAKGPEPEVLAYIGFLEIIQTNVVTVSLSAF